VPTVIWSFRNARTTERGGSIEPSSLTASSRNRAGWRRWLAAEKSSIASANRAER
jgi:hypothetical protein